MEPPLKRPRLSIFEQNDLSGEALDNARYNNDMTLKSRFEAIFEKYSHDFGDVGDEVDIMTGEIVVNRGHIEHMETETDPGYGGTINGASLLLAMSAESKNGGYPGPDDVLQSIEMMAENAGITDDMTFEDGEDNMFDALDVSYRSRSTTNAAESQGSNMVLDPYNSDTDSLFGHTETRSMSADSLFDQEDYTLVADFQQDTIQFRPPSSHNLVAEDEEILARFGPDVGQEVIQLLDQQHDSHVEPAWKIPVRIEPPALRRPTPNVTSSPPVEVSAGQKNSQSLWKAPRPVNQRRSVQSRKLDALRDESEDPLQDGFSSDRQSSLCVPRDDEGASDETGDLIMHAKTTGSCPYCNTNYNNKSGVMAHWDRLLRNPSKLPENDTHDLDIIGNLRSTVVRRIRLPRLVLYDFRTMVEMHEGAGQSFEEIAESRVLRTRKTGLRLQDVYNQHRTPAYTRSTPEPSTEWSAEEITRLHELSQNSLLTLATLRRELKTRTELEIGNKLAEMWLEQLKSVKPSIECSSAAYAVTSAVSDGNHEFRQNTAVHHDHISVKEESEDELFT